MGGEKLQTDQAPRGLYVRRTCNDLAGGGGRRGLENVPVLDIRTITRKNALWAVRVALKWLGRTLAGLIEGFALDITLAPLADLMPQ